MTVPNDAYLHAAELIAGADALVIAAGLAWALTPACQTFAAMTDSGKPTRRLDTALHTWGAVVHDPRARRRAFFASAQGN